VSAGDNATGKQADAVFVGEYVIARCRDAGVHAGYLVSTDERYTVLRESRRLWYWRGAASLSQVAVYGFDSAKSEGSMIGAPEPLKRLRDSDICELTVCTDAGRDSIKGMPEWRA
jgi:hypothetical protein